MVFLQFDLHKLTDMYTVGEISIGNHSVHFKSMQCAWTAFASVKPRIYELTMQDPKLTNKRGGGMGGRNEEQNTQ